MNVRAFNIVQEAIGEENPYIPEDEEENEKNSAAVSLGRRGGKARASAMTKKQRSEAAKKAARTRWDKEKSDPSSD